ncbi:MAG: cysteine desulfurase [Candidatus Thermoplasmatota archaeon]|nr:cysteine desulfurase [Candidatus Thermoplasmatota archaeon]
MTTRDRSVYLDYQSAKPVDPRVVEAMTAFHHERFGNPSSLHSVGDDATETLDVSRAALARYLGARPEEIIFTAGATEANNLALIGYALRNKRKGDHIIITEMEHISIHNIAKYLEKQGYTVSRVPLDQHGRVSMRKLRSRIRDETILISVGLASSEIGTIQPIQEVAELVRNKGIALHTDAVAAQGLLPLDVGDLGVDMMSLSSNDFYGPRGLGALYVRKGTRLNPVNIGGGQENGLRSGSENMPGIVGMAAAVEILEAGQEAEVERIRALRDRLIEGVLGSIPKVHLNGHPTERLPNNAHFRFEGIEGESLLLSLRDEGIQVATGSACSSKTLEPSHTLIACGLLHEEAHGSLELTLGRWSTDEDVDAALEAIPKVVKRLRDMSPLYKEDE